MSSATESEAPDLEALEARINAAAEAMAKRPVANYAAPEPEAAPETTTTDVLDQIEAARRAIEEGARRAPKKPCAECGAPVPALTSAMVPSNFSYRDEVPRPDPGHVCADCYVTREHRALFAQALQSVPERYRWARFGHEFMASRVQPCRGVRPDETGRLLRLDVCGRPVAKAERVLLMGPAGVGKTVLAAALLHEVIDQALSPDVPARVADRARLARFLHAYDLTTDDKASLEQARHASVLVIDDLGRDPDSYKSAVAETIHRRHAHGRTTWVTTGLRPEELLARYPTLERRLFEGAAVYSFFTTLGDSLWRS